MSAVLEFENLLKEFRGGLGRGLPLTAVDNLNLSIEKGEIFGFLGPNGAGKTTTLKITLGFLRATRGRVSVFGQDAAQWWVRERLGYLPENPIIYPYLNGRQALTVFGRMFNLGGADIRRRIDSLAAQLGLDRELTMPIRKHSKGMLQRVALAGALINDPELVILDEPMSGLDPIGRKMFREVILRLKEQGKTVFFSSHILSDIEMICDRVGLLNRGRLVLDTSMKDIIEQQKSGGPGLEEIFMKKVGADS